MRKFVFMLVVMLPHVYLSAQLQTPEQFLGYQPGAQFTPYWKIVNYIEHVAQQSPKRVALRQYGTTNEGRPLMVSMVSTEENIAKLESIRQNNLRLAGQSPDKKAGDENAPAIIWLSYNVHGDEPACSEAAMLALYAFANPADARISGWLKNTVVVIDACLNPDGRDRYVNWFNSVAGRNFDPSVNSREHQQPWPGGRSNHYNYDLNRDWAWQTQKESQQRVKLYNSWLPQVHVDYHEQSINEPYYFAPAAQPYHEVITPWQREFQLAIGKKHAEYFDANGWLYFTKEVFDLYYPSYGDTYPLYNGAIGMTYEQGGGPVGGLGVLTDDGDTLTLTDRVQHHFLTSLSTLEVASANAARLVKEFRKYFSDAVAEGDGEYKTFIIKNDSGSLDKISALLRLLDKNNILYSNGEKAAGRGFNFISGRDESFSVNKEDIIISTYQPRAALVKVLFEPRSKLVDSLTYDITAWALPYVYGLNAYASREKLASGGGYMKVDFAANVPEEGVYGYVIKWESIKAVKVLAQLLKMNVKVRFAEEPFETGGAFFERGSLIILKTSNQQAGNGLWTKIAAVCNSNEVIMYAVKTGFVDKGNDFGSGKVRAVKTPRIAVLTGELVNSLFAGEVWHFFDQEIGYPVSLVNVSALNTIRWEDFNILIMPEGSYRLLNDHAVADQLKSWIAGGGKLIAMGGAAKRIASLDWGLELNKGDDDKAGDDEKDNPYYAIKKYNSRERDSTSLNTPGSIFKIDLDNTHPLAFGYPDHYYTLKLDGNIYNYFEKEGWNVGTIRKTNYVSGFVGSGLKNKLKDGLLLGVLTIGKGEIVILADDPLFRSFWENGKLLFSNAVFLVGD